MIKIILNIIGVILGFILLIGGITLVGNCAVSALEELMVINETIAINIYGIIWGMVISVIGYHIIMYLIKD